MVTSFPSSGVVYVDETIIEDTFVSTSLVNTSRLTLAGKEIGTTLAEFNTRLNVLDQYLKTADVTHYYAYYFGVSLTDGGRARDGVSSYAEIYDPYGITVATIGGHNYAFVAASGDDTIVFMNASEAALDGTIGTEIPLILNYNNAYDSNVGGNLDYPRAIDYHMIGSKHYIFVSTINTDGIMIIDVSDVTAPLFVSYTDDTNVNFDKIANSYGLKAWTIGGAVYLAVASYSSNTATDGGNGVQIMDVSDPANPKFAASMVDGSDNFRCLNNPWGVDMIDVNGVPFLFVAAVSDDCMQVIDMTDPEDPVAAFAYTDMFDVNSYMNNPRYVKAFEVNNRYYAAVNALSDRTITVVDVTDPYDCKQASAMSYTSSYSSTGQQFYGFGSDTSHDGQMDVYRTTDVFGRVNTFMVTLGRVSYGSFSLMDISDPTTPIAVAWVQGTTSTSGSYYMMYYYPRAVRVVENNGKHYALVVSEYGSESTSYPNGVQVIKIDPLKTWDLGTTWASDSNVYY